MADQEMSVEERAKILGHVPLEDFKGDPDKWVPAEQWVERTEKLFPINKAMVKKLTEDIAMLRSSSTAEKEALTQEIADLKRTLGEFAEFSKKGEERAYKRAVAELEAKQRQAVADGDTEAFDQVKAELDSLREIPLVVAAEKAEAAAEPPKKGWPFVSDPEVFKGWMDDDANAWYKSEPEMAIYAHQCDEYLKNTTTFPTQRDQLDKVTELVQKKFPQFFQAANQNPNRDKPPSVEGGDEGAPAPGKKGKKSYNDLNAEERRVCDEWTGKDGKGTGIVPNFTREDWLKQYFGQ